MEKPVPHATRILNGAMRISNDHRSSSKQGSDANSRRLVVIFLLEDFQADRLTVAVVVSMLVQRNLVSVPCQFVQFSKTHLLYVFVAQATKYKKGSTLQPAQAIANDFNPCCDENLM
jgi:hypothetical protein